MRKLLGNGRGILFGVTILQLGPGFVDLRAR